MTWLGDLTLINAHHRDSLRILYPCWSYAVLRPAEHSDLLVSLLQLLILP